MRISELFAPLLKENPTEASIVSHRLMLRAGMIRMVASGIYSWLPLGLKYLKNIEKIIRDEMDKAGCQEILMSCIQPANLWKESNRYDDYGPEMLRFLDRHDNEILFGPTNEEVVTDIFRNNIKTYRDLPKNLYQIQWKFRDEIRPRFGVMRGREFLMKDAYSFDIDPESAEKAYFLMFETYLKIFYRMGLKAIPIRANTGPIGGNLSHEFHIVADTGESEIFYDQEFDNLSFADATSHKKLLELYSAADERHDPANCPIPESKLKTSRGIEVGHIFYFGTKYSKALNAYITNNKGERVLAEMGSYGVGVSRLTGAIIEASHDDKGIIFHPSVAPYKISVINLKVGDENSDQKSENLYQKLKELGIDVLYDDSRESVGSKFATNDLIGTPYIVAIGPRGLEQNKCEFKDRKTGVKEDISLDNIVDFLSQKLKGY